MDANERDSSGEKSFRPAIYRLLQVSALMLKTREHYAAAVDVTPPQFSILTAIAERPATSIGEVAERLHVSGPFVTAEVNKLINAGMVVKHSSASDRRLSELRITEECEQRLSAVSPLREAANARIFADLSPPELDRFSSDLSALIVGLRDALHMLSKPMA
jgi:DNA-binding MarR family transcriptional regulator